MQVRALRAGFYGGDLKQAGEVFTVVAGQSASWFVPVQAQDAGTVTREEIPEPGKPRRGRPPSTGSRPKPSPSDPVTGPADPDLP